MKPIYQLIKPSLAQKSQKLDHLQDILLACLPQNCHSHLSIANLNNKQLTLVTDSSVWASRLRLYTNTMLDMLQQHGNTEINRIKVRQIQTHLNIKPEIKKKQRQMSSRIGVLISQSASSVEDEALKSALLKLAKNAK